MDATLSLLRASAERIAQLQDQLADERARRNQLVVALVDQGVSRREIAAAGRMSPKSVCVHLSDWG